MGQQAFESGGLTITCTILFPEQFDALRRTYDCEKSMIESLARCIKWNASGGKSGSAFLKTQGRTTVPFGDHSFDRDHFQTTVSSQKNYPGQS